MSRSPPRPFHPGPAFLKDLDNSVALPLEKRTAYHGLAIPYITVFNMFAHSGYPARHRIPIDMIEAGPNSYSKRQHEVITIVFRFLDQQ